MSLTLLQTGLQSIYELEIDHNIENFILTNKSIANHFCQLNSNLNTREKLLVHQDEEGLNLSLYLEQELLDHYLDSDPLSNLGGHNIQEFCIVLEGISHFLYLAWNASHDRSVTLLEMELQAEVDKFIMLMDCLERQSISSTTGQVSKLLFEKNIYHADLSGEELQRYVYAAKYARQYCRRLEDRYFEQGDRMGLLSELRKFYRLTKPDKLDRINQHH
ncbi:MAG: hypothetical protein HKN08_09285 [Gammaproteobacteria bacterium]|nr:hypothetical protein [Gammaproteobacteria bacterium]